jgi:transcriptional regulator with XRE-family HTH domain
MRGYRNIYEPLRIYLSRHPAYKLNLTFREIESILGTRLPKSAFSEKAWWSNRKSRLQASAWLCADCRVSAVDFLNREVTFQRCVVRGLRHIFGDPVWDRSDIRRLRRHLRLNQTAFAAVMGVSLQTVSRWETGRRAPTPDTDRRLTLIAQRAKFSFDIGTKLGVPHSRASVGRTNLGIRRTGQTTSTEPLRIPSATQVKFWLLALALGPDSCGHEARAVGKRLK